MRVFHMPAFFSDLAMGASFLGRVRLLLLRLLLGRFLGVLLLGIGPRRRIRRAQRGRGYGEETGQQA